MSYGLSRKANQPINRGRLYFVQAVLLIGAAALLWRMATLNTEQSEFLKGEGDARALRVVEIPAHRGVITDRNGEPLAISTPIESVWANPKVLISQQERLPALARATGISLKRLKRKLTDNSGRGFIYLKRHVSPDVAEKVAKLDINGVDLQREYRRYYPMGEVASHVVGFTNIDDRGQEGAELMMDEQLRGISGSKRVIKDLYGRIVENVERISPAMNGENIQLSIDKRVQYLAYRELKATVQRHQAKGGSAVVLDTQTGEVLAMVNQPSYNPNNRRQLTSSALRNRAVTDVMEPGSTMKPFTIAAALESGLFKPDSIIETSPGRLKLAGFTIRDFRDYGTIDVTTVMQKSSNVGMSKIAMALDSGDMWGMLSGLGFGYDSGSHFPGESSGRLKSFQQWRKVEQATIGYGYGLSATPLQLARAYAAIAADGVVHPVSFIKYQEGDAIPGERVIQSDVAHAVRKMMETVTQTGGTGTKAQVAGYRVAGKTGTVRKAANGGYDDENYLAIFAGMAPASDPRLVMVSLIDQPQSGEYYGGAVAGPLFSKVMAGALRLLDIPPDDLGQQQPALTASGPPLLKVGVKS
ncbi:MAG: penicillin-binding transpeptidase domain-containing protein [Gammaproteobacteria bacterium]|nr:penicillin-binding transpeptidase domain-containing protein [Gammaproteobacteria bacterium]